MGASTLPRSSDSNPDRTPATRPASHRKNKAKLPPQAVPIRPPADRVCDFEPIMLDFDAQSAIAEADRCLGCPRQPCVDACPLNNDIPTALRLISDGQFVAAAQVYFASSPMPEICSRVCPQENLCEGACVLAKRGTAVACGALERFVTDVAHQQGVTPQRERIPRNGHSVGIIGAGPAGLSAAQHLLESGHAVTIYEAWAQPGGWMTYTIPSFKLPRPVLERKFAEIADLGGDYVLNTRVGVDVSLDELRARHDAVFIGVGAMQDTQIAFEGDDLPGVYTGTEFLLPVYTPRDHWPEGFDYPATGERVVVFGGGDTAMDCVRTAVRMQHGAGLPVNVHLLYRRTQAEMPASTKEQKAAQDEGVIFDFLVAPVAFHAGPDGRLAAVTVQRMELGEPDASGRRRPVPIAGSETRIEADVVVLALGYGADPLLSEHAPDLETRKWGLIVTDPATGATNLPGVFAGGDAVRGPNLVSRAAQDGRVAAGAIRHYLQGGAGG